MNAPEFKTRPADISQAVVIAFLRDPANHRGAPERVDVIETHGAMVFLAGDTVLKVKRSVQFPYMDFSTLERRRAMCLREFDINSRNAPGVYESVVPITLEADGRLQIGGDGAPVEWAVQMKRFDQADLMSSIARRRELDPALIRRLAAVVADFHTNAEVTLRTGGTAPIEKVLSELEAVFASAGDVLATGDIEAFSHRARAALEANRHCLSERADLGQVRRCHGDLHLNNIVVLNGTPVLFDAIEFNDAIATIDTLYDLAFLLMDLDHNGLRDQANLLLNRYLYHRDREADLSGLTALPLFLCCRAGIRAMVAVQRGRQIGGDEAAGHHEEAQRYFRHALSYLEPQDARLVAVGGFSGTGKSTLSAALAPLSGAAPGAIHLRSDLERKAMFGAEEIERLDQTHYTRETSRRVYRRILSKARVLLAAGRGVVIDAVFAGPEERFAAEQLAVEAGVEFQGLWLTAPPGELRRRVDTRRGDASDATADVVDSQLTKGAGDVGWAQVEAGGRREDTLETARRILGFD